MMTRMMKINNGTPWKPLDHVQRFFCPGISLHPAGGPVRFMIIFRRNNGKIIDEG